MMDVEEENGGTAVAQPTLVVRGAALWAGFLDPRRQEEMLRDIRAIWAAAPPLRPQTRWGKPMSVEMTSAGRFGWFSDRRGYRYLPEQPDGRPWPPIPDSIRAVWDALAGTPRAPDCCLVNRYCEKARMGLHQDRDEADFRHPVVSISLGDEALFRIGGTDRRDPTESVWLRSGDVLVLSGPSRMAFHGIDRLRFGSSRLIEGGGRVNVTLRVVE